jgi:hypothetical protein
VLALAIGGQTAIFGLLDAALPRALPYREPHALVAISHETDGALGALVAELLTRLFLALGPGDVPRLDQARLDPRSLLFLAGCTGATAVLFGLLPALRSTASLHAGARDGSSYPGSERLRRALAALQLALTLVLLSGAGLLLRSLLAAGAVELGFEAERALVSPHVYEPASQSGDATPDLVVARGCGPGRSRPTSWRFSGTGATRHTRSELTAARRVIHGS